MKTSPNKSFNEQNKAGVCVVNLTTFRSCSPQTLNKFWLDENENWRTAFLVKMLIDDFFYTYSSGRLL